MTARCAACGEEMHLALAKVPAGMHPCCEFPSEPIPAGAVMLPPGSLPPPGRPRLAAVPDPGPASAGTCVGCGRTDTRLYPAGPKCPAHTPAARAGQPEPDAARYCAPLRCYCGGCASYARPLEPVTATVVDVRAVASGKRRVRDLAEYRAAQDRRRKEAGR